ncbi:MULTISPECIES: helix-turn-helix domain-containing protein [unclassified Campylobacter]|uniref:helix-turn-helix domain-containing protein n=1 Tax=unclassified Campylobacter TaxID=2593542 RepID=UPI003D34FABD
MTADEKRLTYKEKLLLLLLSKYPKPQIIFTKDEIADEAQIHETIKQLAKFDSIRYKDYDKKEMAYTGVVLSPSGTKEAQQIKDTLEAPQSENIVKRVCRELNITQRELAERIGVANNTTAQWATQTKPPEMAVKFMELLLEHEKTKKQLDKFKKAFELIDEAKTAR